MDRGSRMRLRGLSAGRLTRFDRNLNRRDFAGPGQRDASGGRMFELLRESFGEDGYPAGYEEVDEGD